jgi:hypothetical protein
MSDRIALARAIARRFQVRFIEINRERNRRLPPVSSDELLAIKQGRWAEKERESIIRCWQGDPHA